MKDRPERTGEETYTLTIKTEEITEEEILVKIGLEREFDNAPFIFKTNSFGEMMNVVSLLQEEEEYEGSWILTKKEG